MQTIIGPVLKRTNGYGFDTWTVSRGVKPGFSYSRIEDAIYDRNATIRASEQTSLAAIVCQTLEEFFARSAAFAA